MKKTAIKKFIVMSLVVYAAYFIAANSVQAAGGYSPYGPYAPHEPEDTGLIGIELLSIAGIIMYGAGIAFMLNVQKIKSLLS